METAKIIGKDILETATAKGHFKSFEKALKAADLVGTLKGKGPFTVFAPTDAAFAQLPEGQLEALLKPEGKAKLVELLKHHVMAGKHMAAELTKTASAKTLDGSKLTVMAADSCCKVGTAKVSRADIECSNGVIHEIDVVQTLA